MRPARPTPRGRDPNLRVVEVDGVVVCELRASDVEALGLVVGREWDAALRESVERLLAVNAARAAALKHLAKRTHLRCQLRDKLLQRCHDADVIEIVLDELEQDAWIDDEAAARQLALRWTHREPAGRAYLAERLMDKGVAADVAERIAAEAALTGERLVEVVDALLAAGRGPQRVVRRLLRAGVDADVVRAAAERAGIREVEYDAGYDSTDQDM